MYHITEQENLPLRGSVLHFLWCEQNQLSVLKAPLNEMLPLDLLIKPHMKVMCLTFPKSEQTGHCKGVFFPSDKLITVIDSIRNTVLSLNENLQ